MTTTDTILNKGLTLDVGGIDVTFKPLPIAEDMEWRRRIGRIIGDVVKRQQIRDDNVQAELLSYFFSEGLDELTSTMFLLADQPLDVVVAKATRQELTTAMVEVYKAYFTPFVSSIVEIWATLRPTNG